MSYCGPLFWTSLHDHARLFYNYKFNPRRVGVQHWQPPDLVDPYLWRWEYIPDPPRWDPGYVRERAEPLMPSPGSWARPAPWRYGTSCACRRCAA